MSNQLLPCPFCGRSDCLLIEHMEGTVLHPAYRVCCDNCGSSSRFTDNGHIEAWNSRATQPAAGTTSDQYRAELYDEVWQKARDMGYANVTDALVELERLKATRPAAGEPVYQGFCNGEWRDISHQAFIKIQQQHKTKTRTLWTAPPAAAHGDEAVLVGEAGTMPGTSGFTLASFTASAVPVGTKLYTMRTQAGEGSEV